MVQLNLALREINCKIVYFGCGLGGKTTNLEIVHEKASPESRGELTSIATESDRTLFFDFMPLDLGEVSGMRIKFQLYTVPGQVYYNSTRKLVLRGADGVIFVADSQKSKLEENIESLDNLEECLKEQGRSLDEMPHVIQFNKRDLDDIMSVDEMAQHLNRYGASCHEATAASGEGVLETFKALAAIMLEKVKAMSTESAAKPRASQKAMPPQEKKARDITDAQRLQGGIAATPAKPTPMVRMTSSPIESAPQEPARPAGFESNAMPQRPAAAASLNDPEGSHEPVEEVSAAQTPVSTPQPPAPGLEPGMEPSAPPAATMERVAPSIRAPREEEPVSPPEPPQPEPRRRRGAVTTGPIQITGNGMMISSSSRRRSTGEGRLFWILGVVVLGAAAAGWYFFLR